MIQSTRTFATNEDGTPVAPYTVVNGLAIPAAGLLPEESTAAWVTRKLSEGREEGTLPEELSPGAIEYAVRAAYEELEQAEDDPDGLEAEWLERCGLAEPAPERDADPEFETMYEQYAAMMSIPRPGADVAEVEGGIPGPGVAAEPFAAPAPTPSDEDAEYREYAALTGVGVAASGSCVQWAA